MRSTRKAFQSSTYGSINSGRNFCELCSLWKTTATGRKILAKNAFRTGGRLIRLNAPSPSVQRVPNTLDLVFDTQLLPLQAYKYATFSRRMVHRIVKFCFQFSMPLLKRCKMSLNIHVARPFLLFSPHPKTTKGVSGCNKKSVPRLWQFVEDELPGMDNFPLPCFL